MAHEIEIIGGKAQMAFAGQTPWHGLGTVLTDDDVYNWESTSTKAGLDWTAEKIGLQTVDKQQPVTHFAIRRSTDNSILGVVGPQYVPLQNKEAFQWFQPFLDAKEAKLHTAGSLRQGSRVWVLAELNREPLTIVPGDKVVKFLLLSHSHDGTLAIRCGFTPVRVLCANTLAMAHNADASKLIRIRHVGKVVDNLNAVREVMNLADKEFQATAEQYKRLANKYINQQDLRKYVKKVLKIEEEDSKISTRSDNIIKSILKLAVAGKGNSLPGVTGTLWAGYNAVTEYLGYVRGGSQENRLNALWFGEGAATNKLALQTALDLAV
jgi:phage/plasmid-like protein (TIGR03299 family)